MQNIGDKQEILHCKTQIMIKQKQLIMGKIILKLLNVATKTKPIIACVQVRERKEGKG